MNTAIALGCSSAAALTLSLSYIYWLHHSLEHNTHRVARQGFVAAQSVSLDNLETVDKQVFSSGRYLSVYERAWRVVHRADLPGDAVLSKTTAIASAKEEEGLKEYDEKLLTAYLRHTMVKFSRYLPQSYLLRLIAATSQKETFGATHIQSLQFREGDVVCGFYRVLLRRAGKVEFGIDMPGEQKIEARLVIGICESGNNNDDKQKVVEVYSETVMWRPADRPDVVMPLERGLGKFMHELAAWWLLDSGVSYLVGLGVNKNV
ncbi:uncharacterized protein TRUGW13939_06010 [Talaromyces rugulosus]|uniref:Uncharacterized protein n=1 Tax=Talaromyces rugulosus TaxID=121627 RepID=A0A7H8QXS3_TALRU|nr:uncharacterized protein TRUGW13939_06010 [Talaromyces rugulosus]QKX58882.1 hypothetical protein TRUGW13939_06010 [Talaromyces rugulosus]